MIDDRSGTVIEAWTGHQVGTPLARGYDGAVAGIANHLYVWLPLCLLFLAPFFDPRRPFRLLHLDLLVLLGFGVSQIFFNRGEIGVSVPLVYPVLAYVFVRMLVAGFSQDGSRERRERLVPWVPAWALVAAIVVLAVFRIGVNVAEDKVIDVGYAGVIGADRIAHGHGRLRRAPTGRRPRSAATSTARPTTSPTSPSRRPSPGAGTGTTCRPPTPPRSPSTCSRRSACSLLGLRLRAGSRGPHARPRALLRLARLSLHAVHARLGLQRLAGRAVPRRHPARLRSPLARGATAAFGGLTKFGSLALAPLFAAGTGERRGRSFVLFTLGFLAVAALLVVPLFIPDGGLRELYDRSLGYQASRGRPFSIWGLAPRSPGCIPPRRRSRSGSRSWSPSCPGAAASSRSRRSPQP